MGTHCLSLTQLNDSAPAQKTKINVRSLRVWFRRASPTALLCSFGFTLKYFPQTETNLSKCSSHLCLRYQTLSQVSDLRLLPVPQVPPAPVLLLFHTHTRPFTFASGCTRKSNVKKKSPPPAEEGNYPQPLPRERLGWGCQKTQAPPLQCQTERKGTAQAASPPSSTAGTTCHLHTRPCHHQRLLTTSSRGSKKSKSSLCQWAQVSRFLSATFWSNLSLQTC